MRPGAPVGAIYAAYIRTLEKAGYLEDNLNSCGYSLGTTFSPNWMDWPMCYRNNPVEIVPGMVFFLHMAVTAKGLNVAPGETFLVTERGSERLGRSSIALTLECTKIRAARSPSSTARVASNATTERAIPPSRPQRTRLKPLGAPALWICGQRPALPTTPHGHQQQRSDDVLPKSVELTCYRQSAISLVVAIIAAMNQAPRP